MSLWSRLRRRREGGDSKASRPAEAEEAIQVAPELERLAQLGTEDGPGADEALGLLRALRATPDEAKAIDTIASAAAIGHVPERLLVATAAALVDRDQKDRALALVAGGRLPCTSIEARMLAADLHEARGDLPLALALVERVLVRDLDYPGARERHRRWRLRLGLDAEERPAIDRAAATVVTREPEGPFLLHREVARGGAGAVYEAEDRELHRPVALKVYHRAERDRPQLLHEARVAAMLAGPGVVGVLDIDPDRGWLALEWAPGGSLRQRLREGDRTALLPLRPWVFPLAELLARVHASGWVHHDVKPANVLFDAAGAPLLADFGTARKAGEPSPPGSLGYVSPERIAGRSSDPRDDVFGFGRILEDTLLALGEATATAEVSALRVLAAACTGPDGARPADGRAIVTRLRVEAPARAP